jgi:hypothetical protein
VGWQSRPAPTLPACAGKSTTPGLLLRTPDLVLPAALRRRQLRPARLGDEYSGYRLPGPTRPTASGEAQRGVNYQSPLGT